MRTLLLSFVIALTSFSSLHADINFNFTYADVTANNNFGFDDPTLGATRRATVEAVADYINTVVDHNGSVDIRWNVSTNAPSSGTLASMGSFYFGNAGITNGFVFDHATTGSDPFGGEVDGQGQVNFGRNWNSDLGGPSGSEFDLFSVVLHEISHSMGFASLFNPTGSSQISGTRTVYDSLLTDGSGNALLSGTNFVGNASVFTSGDLFIDLSGTGGGSLELYAPGSFQPGSSISHLDFSVPGDNVMVPAIAPGVAKREYSDADLAVLRGIGWNVVPEPNSMLVLTGCTIALLARRRRLS